MGVGVGVGVETGGGVIVTFMLVLSDVGEGPDVEVELLVVAAGGGGAVEELEQLVPSSSSHPLP